MRPNAAKESEMERNGKTLKTLADGHPRRLADGRNAWRKMTPEQRVEFLAWQFGGDITEIHRRVVDRVVFREDA